MFRVLVACESSGAVRRAFNARPGVEAWSCDLQPADDGDARHIQGDVRPVLAQGWHLMIGHPPCKYVSASGMHWTTRGLRPVELTHAAIEFAELLWNAPIRRICIENPSGALATKSKLGEASQTIQPFKFLEDASKLTCLWLKNLPTLRIKGYAPPRMVCPCGEVYDFPDVFAQWCPKCGREDAKPRWANQTDSGQNKLGPSDTRWKERSKTYGGIAEAMAEQWTADFILSNP